MRTPQVQIADLDTDCITCLRGVSRIFERGGPISLGSLKKSSDFKRGGGESNGLIGGPVH